MAGEVIYDDPSIKLADNGFIVCYTEKTKKASGGTYDGYDYDYKELVFTEEQESEAMKKFIEIGKLTGKLKGASSKKKSSESEEGEEY